MGKLIWCQIILLRLIVYAQMEGVNFFMPHPGILLVWIRITLMLVHLLHLCMLAFHLMQRVINMQEQEMPMQVFTAILVLPRKI